MLLENGFSLLSFQFELSYITIFRIVFGFQYYCLCFFRRMFSFFSSIFVLISLVGDFFFFVFLVSFKASLFAFATIFCCLLVSTLGFSSSLKSSKLGVIDVPFQDITINLQLLITVLSGNDSQIMIELNCYFYIFALKLKSGIK